MGLNGFKFVGLLMATLEWGLTDPTKQIENNKEKRMRGYQLVFFLGIVTFYIFQSANRKDYMNSILVIPMDRIKKASEAVRQVLVLEHLISNLHKEKK